LLRATVFPYTTLFRSCRGGGRDLPTAGGASAPGQVQAPGGAANEQHRQHAHSGGPLHAADLPAVHRRRWIVRGRSVPGGTTDDQDRKSTRLNSSHVSI